jgi:hypothetical protein
MQDTDRYAVDGHIDVEAIERDGHGAGDECEICGEMNPCSLAWVADRLGRQRGIGRSG